MSTKTVTGKIHQKGYGHQQSPVTTTIPRYRFSQGLPVENAGGIWAKFDEHEDALFRQVREYQKIIDELNLEIKNMSNGNITEADLIQTARDIGDWNNPGAEHALIEIARSYDDLIYMVGSQAITKDNVRISRISNWLLWETQTDRGAGQFDWEYDDHEEFRSRDEAETYLKGLTKK